MAGCLAPALDSSDYRFKASRTAEEVASALQTAGLAVNSAERHELPLPPIEVAVHDAEDQIGASTGSFKIVKPPNEPMESLREDTLDLVEQAEDAVSEARIALQQLDLPAAVEALSDAQELAEELESFGKQVEP
jgi:hypothetical protein